MRRLTQDQENQRLAEFLADVPLSDEELTDLIAVARLRVQQARAADKEC